jgi:hypothetical protein
MILNEYKDFIDGKEKMSDEEFLELLDAAMMADMQRRLIAVENQIRNLKYTIAGICLLFWIFELINLLYIP